MDYMDVVFYNRHEVITINLIYECVKNRVLEKIKKALLFGRKYLVKYLFFHYKTNNKTVI